MSGGTLCTSAECPGGHCALVQNVRGDILHGGTFRPPTDTIGRTLRPSVECPGGGGGGTFYPGGGGGGQLALVQSVRGDIVH